MSDRRSYSFRFASQYRPRGAGFEISALIDLGLLVPLFLFVGHTILIQPAITLDLPETVFSDGVAPGSVVVTVSRENMVFFNDERTTLEGLPSAFRQMNFRNPESTLIVEADEQVPYLTLMKIYNLAHQAGVQKVALATGILGDVEDAEGP